MAPLKRPKITINLVVIKQNQKIITKPKKKKIAHDNMIEIFQKLKKFKK